MGKVLDLNANLILLEKWPRSLHAVRRALFVCFSSLFVQIAACNVIQSKIKNHRYHVFLDYKLTKG